MCAGIGLMLAIELDSADLAKQAVADMLARHILINRTSETVLRFLPPFILKKEHVDTAIAALDEIFTEHAAASGDRKLDWRDTSWPAKHMHGKDLKRSVGTLPSPVESLAGRDLCSIADFSTVEIAALMKLAHAVKADPGEYRWALDAKQMVMFFEKASLRTRLTFETAINTLGGNAIFVDQTQSPLGERESLADMARNLERWVSDHRAPHLRARHHHRDGAVRNCALSSTPSAILNIPARRWPIS